MASFGHGGNIKEISRKTGLDYKNIIDFSANINPLGMPSSVKKAIIEGIDEIEKYPDITYFELKKAITNYENNSYDDILNRKNKYEDINKKVRNIKEEDLILGNGAAEVLFNVVRGINPKKVLVLAPTFSEYEEATRAVDGEIIYYNLKEENNFTIQEDILDMIDYNLDLIFICNPNNPTGVVTYKRILEKILIKAKDNNVILIMDESFLDFIEEDISMISYINEYDNLIIIKSLTKLFALPGIRIGYGICRNIDIKYKINKISPAWNINILAEIATKTALKDKTYIKETLEFIKNEKEYLYNELRKLEKIKVYTPSVNFILLRTFKDIDLKNELLKHNILVRSCSNYEGLNGTYYRVAIRNHCENIKLVSALKKIIG